MGRDISSSGQASVATPDDSVAADAYQVSTTSIAKVCCTCGRDVAGQKRFKDAQGRYWCPDCVEEDEQRKHPIPCADCQKEFIKKDLLEHEGAQVCVGCHEKRMKAAKRAAARVAAAEEEERRQHARRRVGLIGILTALGVVILFALIWWIAF